MELAEKALRGREGFVFRPRTYGPYAVEDEEEDLGTPRAKVKFESPVPPDAAYPDIWVWICDCGAESTWWWWMEERSLAEADAAEHNREMHDG